MVDRVNLVAHSRGGVISRLAFNTPGFGQQIAGVVTLSSPHNGSDLMYGASIKCVLGINAETQKLCAERAMELTVGMMRAENYGSNCRRKYVVAGPWEHCQPFFKAQEQAAGQIPFIAMSGWPTTGNPVLPQAEIWPSDATFPWRNTCSAEPTSLYYALDQAFDLPHTDTNQNYPVYTTTLQLLSNARGGPIRWPPYPYCPASAAMQGGDLAQPALAQNTTQTELQAAPEHLQLAPGDSITIHARLVEGANVLRAGVTITTTAAGGATIAFHDDGQGGDLTSGDGTFAATLPGITSTGHRAFQVVATWPGGQAEQLVVVSVAADLVRITAIGAEAGGQLDERGRWESLDFPLTLSSPISGTASIAGTLRAPDGPLIAQTQQIFWLTAGTQTQILKFSGDQIHAAQFDGVLQISDLVVAGTLGTTLVSSPSALSRVSVQAYGWREFSGSATSVTIAPEASFKQSAGGTSATLTFSGTATVDFSGEYAIQGNLYTKSGDFVATSPIVTRTLNTATPFSLVFNLEEMTVAGRHPPYTLGNISIWRTDGTGTYLIAGEDLAHWGASIFLPLLRR